MTGSCLRPLLGVFLTVFIPVSLLPHQASLPPRDVPSAASSFGSIDQPGLAPARFPAAIIPTAASRRPFAQMSQAAGLIFSGHVTFVGHAEATASSPAASATVITFRVEHAIHGVSAGQQLTIHEWAGLWHLGERYRVGEHVLLFLFPPSRLGLTSPVSGALGRFPITASGGVRFQPAHRYAFGAENFGKADEVCIAEMDRAVRLARGEGTQ